MGGLSVGILSGLLVSGVVLAAVSLSTPLPPRTGAEELEVTVSAEGEDAAAEVEEAAVEEAAPEAPADEEAETPEAPADEEAEETPAPETEEGAPVEDEPEPAEEPAPAEERAPEEAAPAAVDEETGAAEPAAQEEETVASAPATNVPLPSGSEFNRPPPEEDAVLPSADAAPAAAAPQAPLAAGLSDAPSFDTAPAAQPNVTADSPDAIAAAPALGEAPAAPSGSASVAATGAAPTLSQPATSALPQIETTAAPLPQAEPEPEPEAEEIAEAVEAETAPREEIAELDAAEPEAPALETPRFPTIGGETAEADAAPAEDPVETTTPRFPQVSRLPQAGGGVEEVEETVEAEAEELDPVDLEDLPAIQAYAVPFDANEERPLMAVVLIDDPDSRIEQSTLTRFTFPVAFAVDPMHPDAAERAGMYREAGFEVVMLGSMLPEGATAADTEVAVGAAQSMLPETVALLDTPESRIQGDRPVLDATVALLAETGHGLLAFPRGLNAAEQTASRAGVPGATLFRLLDDEDQRATQITRFLSRAAFTAAQEGTVIVAGHTRPDTVTALFSWALGDRSEAVALAPLSATLLRASER